MTADSIARRLTSRPVVWLEVLGLVVALGFLALLLAGSITQASHLTFTVDSTGDGADINVADEVCDDGSGSCTLRAAIQEANDHAGTDTIAFSIAGAGPHTINPGSALPTITDPVIIDGTSEPDFAGTPIIELDGSGAGASANGLNITAGSSTVKGLVINRFGDDGIELSTNGSNTIEGNYIGTDTSGTADHGNSEAGVHIIGAPSNTVGGTAAGASNVISGNNYVGVWIVSSGATGNAVEGNYIGTDVTGSVAIGNLSGGVFIDGAPSNTIGGTAAGAGNVISGNHGSGVRIGSGATGNLVEGNLIGTDGTGNVALGNSAHGVHISEAPTNTIGGTAAGARNIISGNRSGVRIAGGDGGNVVQGNYIGTDVTGTADLGNFDTGVLIDAAPSNTIGGTAAGASNVISGNNQHGVRILAATGNAVVGNYIGTQADGASALGNTSRGVMIDQGASDNTIGGTAAGAGNTIAFNGGPGVFVSSSLFLSSTGNLIDPNSIHSNTGLGIDLFPNNPDGVTANDAGDGDTGPNNLQNFPVLTSASQGSTEIEGSLNSTASTQFTIQFFSNTACDPSNHGEGETYLDSTTVTTDGTGNVSFSVSLGATVPGGQFITATATDPANNTSEFSECVTVAAGPTSTPTTTPPPTSTPAATPAPTPAATPTPTATLVPTPTPAFTPPPTTTPTPSPTGDTPPGDDVSVPLEGGLGSPGGVELTFPTVAGGGTTTVTKSTGGPPPPTGLKIVGSGGQPIYYDINTTATFSGLVTVCIAYDESEVAGQESNLKLMHDDGSGFIDITSSLDTINNIICGETATLSPFALMVPIPPSVGGIVELAVGSGSEPTAASQSGRTYEREVAALAVALAAVGIAGVYWHRYWRRAG